MLLGEDAVSAGRMSADVLGDAYGLPSRCATRDSPPPADMMEIDFSDENSYRRIKYEFSEDVLRLPRIATM
jgi:hypothetical protein